MLVGSKAKTAWWKARVRVSFLPSAVRKQREKG